MTDRVHSITLVLAKDVRIDDVESLLHACRCFAGVLEARANVADVEHFVYHSRVWHELYDEMIGVLRRHQS